MHRLERTNCYRVPRPLPGLWEVKSSPNTQVRRPRTSTCLQHNPFPLVHQTFSVFKDNAFWNKRKLFVLLQKTLPSAPRTKRTRPGPLFPPRTTLHTAAKQPHSSIPKYVRLDLGQTLIPPSNTEHFILSKAGLEAADGGLKIHGSDKESSQAISCGSPHWITHSQRATLRKQTAVSIPANTVIS